MAKKKKKNTFRIWIDFFLAVVIFIWGILLVRYLITNLGDKIDLVLVILTGVLLLAVIAGRVKFHKVLKKVGM